MSDQRKWGKLSVYLYDEYVRVYFWEGSKMYHAEYSLNKDGSLAERNSCGKLLPSRMWHELNAHSDKIITYLMLKGCV